MKIAKKKDICDITSRIKLLKVIKLKEINISSSKWENEIYTVILLMGEIPHQLISSLFHYLQGFVHPRWCRIYSINGSKAAHVCTWHGDCHSHSISCLMPCPLLCVFEHCWFLSKHFGKIRGFCIFELFSVKADTQIWVAFLALVLVYHLFVTFFNQVFALLSHLLLSTKKSPRI